MIYLLSQGIFQWVNSCGTSRLLNLLTYEKSVLNITYFVLVLIFGQIDL